MKAQPMKRDGFGYIQCPVAEAQFVRLNLPGELSNLMLPVILKGKREGTPCWTWNGDTEKPTLKPSILSSMPPIATIHVFVNDGKVQYLGDSSENANQTLDLLDVEL